MTALHWPPRDRDEMLAWQRAHGADAAVAEASRSSAPSVYRYRARFNVAPVGHTGRGYVRGASLSDAVIADLYDDRTYDDVAEARI